MHFYCHSARSGNALKPQTFLRAQFWHPLSPPKQKWKSQEVPQGLGQQQVVVSIPPLVRGRQWQLRALPASPGTAPRVWDTWTGLGGSRKAGWAAPVFVVTSVRAAGTCGSGTLGTQMPERKSTVSQGCYGACFYPWGQSGYDNPRYLGYLVKCQHVLVSSSQHRAAQVEIWVGQALVALRGVLTPQANPSHRGCPIPTQGFPLRPVGMSLGHSFSTKPNLMISQLQLSPFARAVCQNIQKS